METEPTEIQSDGHTKIQPRSYREGFTLETISQAFKRLRETRGFSVSEVADAVGFSPRRITNFEGGSTISIEKIHLLVRFLKFETIAQMVTEAQRLPEPIELSILGPAARKVRIELDLLAITVAKKLGISEKTLRTFETNDNAHTHRHYIARLLPILGCTNEQELVDAANSIPDLPNAGSASPKTQVKNISAAPDKVTPKPPKPPKKPPTPGFGESAAGQDLWLNWTQGSRANTNSAERE